MRPSQWGTLRSVYGTVSVEVPVGKVTLTRPSLSADKNGENRGPVPCLSAEAPEKRICDPFKS